MMLPLVTLQLTATLAESPVLMNATAVKSAVAFWRRVRILGETNRSAIVLPGSVARTGNSHATIAAQYTRPPPSVLSPPDSSNTMIKRPSCWNTGLAISGAMLVRSQLSAVLKEQSCASLHRLGTMFENVGSVPFAKSVANCVKGTLLHP